MLVLWSDSAGEADPLGEEEVRQVTTQETPCGCRFLRLPGTKPTETGLRTQAVDMRCLPAWPL